MELRKYILSLRKFRVFHRLFGISLALFLTISAVTGIFLALKKDFDFIQPPTQKGQSADLSEWMALEDLKTIAVDAFNQAHTDQADNKVHRMDVRPDKGVVKVLLKKGFWEVQVDGKNGEVLSIARRHSDWIESLHDGSIIGDWFKLLSMNILGLGLIFMIVSGLWLWKVPRLLRKWKKAKK